MSKIVTQISLLQALINGCYDGVISAKELKNYGDIAIGTFDGANGELIMLDNVIYRANINGVIEEVSDDELIPFSNVTKFIEDDKLSLSVNSIAELKSALNEYKNKKANNLFIAIKITGLFDSITYRSIPKQSKPYKNLDYVVDYEQKVYTRKNIEGTIVGFCFPKYLSNINTTDYHMHFISSDKTTGGHLLDVIFQNVNVLISIKNELKLILPNNNDFNKEKFDVKSDVIKKVEE